MCSSDLKVFDVGAEITTFESASPYSRGSPTRSDWKQRTIECHSKSVKRITTESSPDVFLTVSEVGARVRVDAVTRAQCTKQDGTVRQHDLRAPAHRCGADGAACSIPLVKLPHRLFSMSIAPSAPHQLVVAGDDPYVRFVFPRQASSCAHPMQGYLFDRRQIGRLLQAEWGVPVETGSPTSCVRRFSSKAKPAPYDYITAARVSSSNGHEVRRLHRFLQLRVIIGSPGYPM